MRPNFGKFTKIALFIFRRSRLRVFLYTNLFVFQWAKSPHSLSMRACIFVTAVQCVGSSVKIYVCACMFVRYKGMSECRSGAAVCIAICLSQTKFYFYNGFLCATVAYLCVVFQSVQTVDATKLQYIDIPVQRNLPYLLKSCRCRCCCHSSYLLSL